MFGLYFYFSQFMEHTRLNLFRFVKPVLPVYISVVIINIVFVGLDMLSPQISRLLVDEVIIGFFLPV